MKKTRRYSRSPKQVALLAVCITGFALTIAVIALAIAPRGDEEAARARAQAAERQAQLDRAELARLAPRIEQAQRRVAEPSTRPASATDPRKADERPEPPVRRRNRRGSENRSNGAGARKGSEGSVPEPAPASTAASAPAPAQVATPAPVPPTPATPSSKPNRPERPKAVTGEFGP